MPQSSTTRLTTGQFDWSAGVDSNKPTQIASESNPHGLKPNQLQWLVNGTVRGGGIQQRYGWVRRAEFGVDAGRFQEAFMYQPTGNAFPYIMTQIGGRIYRVRVDSDYSIENLSAAFFLEHPSTPERGFMAQGEQFLVMQAGDLETLPLFWDGVSLFRSRGFVPQILQGATFTVPAIGRPVLMTLPAPPATPFERNEIFQIGEYQYQQINPNQQYQLASSGGPTHGANIYANWVTHGIKITIPSGYQFSDVSNKATTLRSFDIQFGTSSNPNPGAVTPLQSVFFVEENLDTSGLFRFETYFNDIPGHESEPLWEGQGISRVTIAIQPDPLAAPAANQVWMINLNDPREGEAITVPSEASQLPAGGPMDYYQGRMWVANGRQFIAGDIVGSPGNPSSGTGKYDFRDSILNITENTFLEGGGAFAVSDNSGNIRALKHTSQLDTATGEGLLFVFTRETIYSINVPVTRSEWAALEEPVQRIALLKYGTTSDWSVVSVNGDLFFQSVDGIRSLTEAIRYFGQWGNVPISSEEALALNLVDRNLLGFASGILFDNRLLQTTLPQESDIGVTHRGLIPLDFDLISTLQEKLPPAWEGMLEGLDILKVVVGDFGGRERAFAMVRSSITGAIEVWELTVNEFQDINSFGDSRVSWLIMTPSYTWNDPFQLKKLDTIELWIDQLFGTVEFQVWYRPDQHPCWEFWHAWTECAARSPCELLSPPPACDYPPQAYKQQYRVPMVLPTPSSICNTTLGRPMDIGFSFQFRILIKGFCRLRGLIAHALPRDRAPFDGLRCNV